MQRIYNLLFFFLAVICMPVLHTDAQILLQYNAPVHGQSLEGLSYIEIINNSGEDVKATVTIRVTESQSGNILTAVFPGVSIRRGNNSIDAAGFSRGKFSFANNYAGQIISRTGRFPEGEYEYCFEAEITDSKTPWPSSVFENCFVSLIQPLTPLLLVNPPDEDINCNTRPSFIWQLPAPLPQNARCRLVLTELRSKQDLAEAINYNMPLINQANIAGNQLLFPSSLLALKEGKKYVWQVWLYSGTTLLRKSEIWTYEVKCDVSKEDTLTGSYRELKDNADGDFLIVDRVLRFSFHNPYNPGILSYSIVNMANPAKTISGLPKLSLIAGLNKYELDFTDNKSFRKGEEYMLKITLSGNRVLRLRFLFNYDGE